jgi:hypothetical protein
LINPLFTQRWFLNVKGFQVPEELDNGHRPRFYNVENGARIPLEVFNVHLKLYGVLPLIRYCAATGEELTVPFIAAEGLSDLQWHQYSKIPDSVSVWSEDMVEGSSSARVLAKKENRSKGALELTKMCLSLVQRTGDALAPFVISKFIKGENDKCLKLRSDCKFLNFVDNAYESEVEPYRVLARCILAIFQKYVIFAQF